MAWSVWLEIIESLLSALASIATIAGVVYAGLEYHRARRNWIVGKRADYCQGLKSLLTEVIENPLAAEAEFKRLSSSHPPLRVIFNEKDAQWIEGLLTKAVMITAWERMPSSGMTLSLQRRRRNEVTEAKEEIARILHGPMRAADPNNQDSEFDMRMKQMVLGRGSGSRR